MDELAALKVAEREANEIIQKARDERKQRLREATRLAKQEVAAWQEEQLADLESKAQAPEGADSQERMTMETAAEMNTLRAEYAANQQAAVDLLLAVVTNVEAPFGGSQ